MCKLCVTWSVWPCLSGSLCYMVSRGPFRSQLFWHPVKFLSVYLLAEAVIFKGEWVVFNSLKFICSLFKLEFHISLFYFLTLYPFWVLLVACLLENFLGNLFQVTQTTVCIIWWFLGAWVTFVFLAEVYPWTPYQKSDYTGQNPTVLRLPKMLFL